MAYSPQDVAAYYVALFAPRTDAYSHWISDPRALRDGQPHWGPAGHWDGDRSERTFVREPLTGDAILAALAGGPSVSTYMTAPDGSSHVFALDLDLDDGFQWAVVIGSLMLDAGLSVYVEPSRRGGHLWGVLEWPLQAKVLRRMMRYFVEQARMPRQWDSTVNRFVDDPRVELRPGADEISPGSLGHALRMPTMPHPKTGKRYRLYWPRGGADGFSEIPDATLSQMLLSIELSPTAPVIDIATVYVPPVDPRNLPRDFDRPRAPHETDEFDGMAASEILVEMWGVLNARPGRAVRCPSHEDTHPSLSILRDDRRVICKVEGCWMNNGGSGRGTYELWKNAPRQVQP